MRKNTTNLLFKSAFMAFCLSANSLLAFNSVFKEFNKLKKDILHKAKTKRGLKKANLNFLLKKNYLLTEQAKLAIEERIHNDPENITWYSKIRSTVTKVDDYSLQISIKRWFANYAKTPKSKDEKREKDVYSFVLELYCEKKPAHDYHEHFRNYFNEIVDEETVKKLLDYNDFQLDYDNYFENPHCKIREVTAL